MDYFKVYGNLLVTLLGMNPPCIVLGLIKNQLKNVETVLKNDIYAKCEGLKNFS